MLPTELHSFITKPVVNSKATGNGKLYNITPLTATIDDQACFKHMALVKEPLKTVKLKTEGSIFKTLLKEFKTWVYTKNLSAEVKKINNLTILKKLTGHLTVTILDPNGCDPVMEDRGQSNFILYYFVERRIISL
jgi:hypothetical protein